LKAIVVGLDVLFIIRFVVPEDREHPPHPVLLVFVPLVKIDQF